MNIEQHVKYALLNTLVRKWPFNHFYAENVFPAAYYDGIQAFLRTLGEKDYEETTNAGTGAYRNRAFSRENMIPGCEFMLKPDFLRTILKIFDENTKIVFPDGKIKVSIDIRLIRDSKEYKIGPHTDARWKLVSLLFYLPPDDRYRDFGTSLFVPKDGKFTCEGGPHHPFEPFHKVFTAPFMPNTCLGFFKTNTSFHGVEPIPVDVRRDVLLYNIYRSPDNP